MVCCLHFINEQSTARMKKSKQHFQFTVENTSWYLNVLQSHCTGNFQNAFPTSKLHQNQLLEYLQK